MVPGNDNSTKPGPEARGSSRAANQGDDLSSTPLVVQGWRGLDGLRAQRDAWNELTAACPVDPLCNGFEWTLAYATTCCESDQIFGWTLTTAGSTPVAILPFRREPRRAWWALPRAILLTDGTFDSDYLDLLLRPGHEQAALDAGLDALADERGIEAVVLSGVPSGSPTLSALGRVLERRRLPRREAPMTCLAAPLPETFDAYLAGLGSRMRSKVRAASRALVDRGAEFAWCTSPEQLPQDLDALVQLHQARWTAIGQPGSFAEPARRTFYESFAAGLLERGELGLARVRLDGRTVACQFGAILDGTYYQLQEGYDPELAKLRPGTGLRAWMVGELIERGVRSYDFMEGASRHKSDWGGQPRPCTVFAFALPTLRGRVAYGARALADRLRGRGS